MIILCTPIYLYHCIILSGPSPWGNNDVQSLEGSTKEVCYYFTVFGFGYKGSMLLFYCVWFWLGDEKELTWFGWQLKMQFYFLLLS
jgi:hypothetical protein